MPSLSIRTAKHGPAASTRCRRCGGIASRPAFPPSWWWWGMVSNGFSIADPERCRHAGCGRFRYGDARGHRRFPAAGLNENPAAPCGPPENSTTDSKGGRQCAVQISTKPVRVNWPVLAGQDADARVAGPGGKMMPAWCIFRDAARAEHLAAEAAALVMPPQVASVPGRAVAGVRPARRRHHRADAQLHGRRQCGRRRGVR